MTIVEASEVALPWPEWLWEWLDLCSMMPLRPCSICGYEAWPEFREVAPSGPVVAGSCACGSDRWGIGVRHPSLAFALGVWCVTP